MKSTCELDSKISLKSITESLVLLSQYLKTLPLILFIIESYCLDYKSDYLNIDIPGPFLWAPSASHCQFECQKNEKCKFFTFNTMTGKCILKMGKSRASVSYGISGPKFCGPVQSKFYLTIVF